ncbi:MAG: hypothetical protein ABL870_10650, partial [Sediminibacterium sp.]
MMRCPAILLLLISLFLGSQAMAQTKKPTFSVGGNAGISYEGYGLSMNPAGNYYAARRPWNLLRFNFSPTFNFGKLSLPFNMNFTPMQTNFTTPSTGGFGSIGSGSQNLWQFLTNPLNNIGVSPTYKWAKLQLGTQYLNYSELSTGDIGLFGYGFELNPGKFRVKFFNGVSQRPINYDAFANPQIIGAYQRNNWMVQLGMEEEGKYTLNLNFAKGKDKINSVNPAPPSSSSILPQEGIVAGIVLKTTIAKDYYFNTELAQSIYTMDQMAAISVLGSKDFQPFISSRISTKSDNAFTASIGRKTSKLDLGFTTKYIGAGFQTAGYPFMQPDRFDYTVNTRFNAWKGKMNITASFGQRINNVSNNTIKTKQLIANTNVFVQFSEKFSLNANYNNMGFEAFGSFALRNVSNDISISPSYNWKSTNIMHLLTGNYSFSKYKEQLFYNPFTLTDNVSNTALITYLPSFLQKKYTTDFTLMYFTNNITSLNIHNSMFSATSNVGIPLAKDKIKATGQLMYTYNVLNGISQGNNIIATAGCDWNISKKMKWNLSLIGNLFKYSSAFTPPNAQYLESTLRTSLVYSFK